MSGFDLKALVVELGNEFKRRGMTKHAAHLRGFYRTEFQPHRDGWSADMVLEWLALLRIGPFGTVYEVHQKRGGCPFCDAKPGWSAVWVEVVWDDGAKIRCSSCGRAWLQLDKR